MPHVGPDTGVGIAADKEGAVMPKLVWLDHAHITRTEGGGYQVKGTFDGKRVWVLLGEDINPLLPGDDKLAAIQAILPQLQEAADRAFERGDFNSVVQHLTQEFDHFEVTLTPDEIDLPGSSQGYGTLGYGQGTWPGEGEGNPLGEQEAGPEIHPLAANDLVVGSPQIGPVGLAVEKDEALPLAAKTIRRSARQINAARRIAVVSEIGPSTRNLVATLIEEIEADRANSEEAHEALEALRELHRVLGEIIQRAEGREPIAAELRALEKLERHVTSTLSKAGVFARKLGLTAILSVCLSAILRVPVDSTMAAAVLAALLATGQDGKAKKG